MSCRSVRSSGFLGTAYLTPRIASVAVLSLPRRAWFRNRFLTWSSASLIRETMWNESSTRSAFGRRSFTLESIHLAPSPVTALMEARCSSAGCRKNRSSTSLPYPSCAQATRLRLWSTATVMYVCPPSCSRSRPRLSRWDRRTCTASRIPPTGRRPCARYGRPSSTRCVGIRPRSSGWRPPPATRTPSRNPR